MKKFKLKKKVRNIFLISLLLIILLSVSSFYGLKYYKQKQYEKTYEYKLNKVGYELEDIKLLEKKLKDKELNYLLEDDVNDFVLKVIKEKFFIYRKFYLYIDYYEKNNKLSSRDVVELVNNNRQNEYYTKTIPTDISKEALMLVDKYHNLNESYSPKDLVVINSSYSWGENGSQKATKVTYDAFMKMWTDANKEGHYLMVNSSYRDFNDQKEIFDGYKNNYGTDYAENYAAHPGFSEHQTGYALDISEKHYSSKLTFPNSQAYNWLKDNAYKYGFVLRYKEDKQNVTGTNFEAWHYRYTGVDAATYIYKNDITFGEYYSYFIGD